MMLSYEGRAIGSPLRRSVILSSRPRSIIGNQGTQGRELLGREALLLQQQLNAGLQFGSPPFENFASTRIASFDQLPYGKVDLPPGFFGRAHDCVLHRRDEGLRPRGI